MLLFGDLDWPLNASRGFVSISWASCSNVPVVLNCHISLLGWTSNRTVHFNLKLLNVDVQLQRMNGHFPGSPWLSIQAACPFGAHYKNVVLKSMRIDDNIHANNYDKLERHSLECILRKGLSSSNTNLKCDSCPSVCLKCLQSVIDSASRLVLSSRFDHVTLLPRQLHWLKVPRGSSSELLAVFVYKCVQWATTPYHTLPTSFTISQAASEARQSADCPSCTSLKRRWPSLPGGCPHHWPTACHFRLFTRCLLQSPVNTYLFSYCRIKRSTRI